MTEIEQLTLNAVAHLSASKSLRKQEPTTTTLREVLDLMHNYGSDQVREALRVLTRTGVITYGNTINDIYFKVNTDEKQQR